MSPSSTRIGSRAGPLATLRRSSPAKERFLVSAEARSPSTAMKGARSTSYQRSALTSIASFIGTTPRRLGIVRVTDHASIHTAKSSMARLSSGFLLLLRYRSRRRAKRNSDPVMLAVIDQVDRFLDRFSVDCQFRGAAL